MRIRKTLGVAAGLTTALLVAGCSTGDGGTTNGDAAAEQDVMLWLYPVIADEAAHKGHWDQVIADFEDQNPGINVDYEIFPWTNRDEAIQTALASKTAPDLIYLIPDQLVAYKDSIEPIGPYLSDERMSDLLPNVVESITLDGDMLGSPILTSAVPLLCNAAAFEAAGVTEYPETWQDFLDIAPKFTDAGMYAASYAAHPEMTLNMTFYPLLWQAGGAIFDEERASVAFDSPEGIDALEFLTSLNELGALEPDILTTSVPTEQTPLAQGKVACSWHHEISQVAPYWDAEDIVVLPPLNEAESATYGTIGSLSMFKDSDSKEAAGAFAEYAGSPDVLVPYLETASYFSPLASTGELYADDPLLSAAEANVAVATVGELHPSSRALMGVLSPEIQAALLGQKTPEQALADAAAAAQPLLAD